MTRQRFGFQTEVELLGARFEKESCDKSQHSKSLDNVQVYVYVAYSCTWPEWSPACGKTR
jgi:hypothetical protein